MVITILKFDFLLVNPDFTNFEWREKFLLRPGDTVIKTCFVSEADDINLLKRWKIRAFVFILLKIMFMKKFAQ